MGIDEVDIGCNMEKPIQYVEHATLDKVDERLRKSVCPACRKGWLLMVRDPKNGFKLVENDLCHLCGQRYIYTDITRVRLEIG